MSVYIPRDKAGKPKTRIFQYDFQIKPKGSQSSKRFFGSTGQKTRRAAERVEERLRELAKLGQLSNTMTVAEACEKYWIEEMSRKRSRDDQATNLEIICTFLGPETLLVDITPGMVAEAAARRARTPLRRYDRRTKKVVPTKTRILPKPASVNRQLIEPLRRLLRTARIVWKVPIDLVDFDWGKLKYEEPEERVRSLSGDEERRYWEAQRLDYHPILEMYLISGRRRSDWCGLSKFKVNLVDGTVTVPMRKRKRSGEMTVELTPRELEIIRQECAKAPTSTAVFTYEKQSGKDKGRRLPITTAGLRRAHETACKAAGIQNFRIHDCRHTFATRLLQAKGNLRVVQKALDHSDLASTVKYTHVTEQEVRDARSDVKVSRIDTGAEIIPLPKKAEKS